MAKDECVMVTDYISVVQVNSTPEEIDAVYATVQAHTKMEDANNDILNLIL